MSDSKEVFRFPVSHIPYLEKHRIFELFHEIARELVIQKPVDHVLFTKELLQNAANRRDVARVVLLHVPKVNTLAIAEGISQISGQVVISKKILEDCLGEDTDSASPQDVARCLHSLIRNEDCYKKGWIIVDCVRSQEVAEQLLNLGILPTHVLHPIAPFHPNLSELFYCNVRPDWPVYRRNINGIRYTFRAVLKEIILNGKKLEEILSESVEICKIRKCVKPVKPRVIILGPRGSGRKFQANMLAQTFNIVCIDFEYLICQAWRSPTDLGEQLRKCKNEICFHSELLSEVVNKRVLEDDCLRKGWVLIGYPFNVTDFRYLDSLDTPPNRVIFLESDLNLCRERLINTNKGSSSGVSRDHIDLVNAELNYFCEHYGSLRKYCGGTAAIVNGNQSERMVHESICAIIMRASPQCGPRKGLSDLDSLSSESTCDCISVPSDVVNCFTRRV